MLLRNPLHLSLLERARLEKLAKSVHSSPFEARRASAVLSYSDGLETILIAKVLRVEVQTVLGWVKDYRDDHENGLKQKPYPEREGKLSTTQEEAIRDEFGANGLKDTAQLQAFVLERFGVVYSRSGAIKLLNRLGFCYKAPKIVNPVAPVEAQEAHQQHYETLKASGEPILFIDAVHPQFQTRAYGGWFLAETKPALRAQTGRQRINVHGALELATGKLIFREDERVNANNFQKLLMQIEAAYPDAPKIHLILDNARYHRANMLQEWLKDPNRRVILHFLPPYCPHFNSIERLWGVMHRAVLRNKTYPSYKHFANACLTFLRQTLPQNWQAYAKTISDNFRIASNHNLNFIQG